MMKWYWLIIDCTRACMHLFIEKSGDLVGCYWYLSDWQTLKNRAMQWCYIVTIWHDSWYVYVVWFHPNGLFQYSKSLFRCWTIVVDNSGNQPSICGSPFQPNKCSVSSGISWLLFVWQCWQWWWTVSRSHGLILSEVYYLLPQSC